MSTDFELFADANLKVPTKLGQLVRFNFNRAQKYLWQTLQEDLASGKPVRWFIIKGRQFGCSTWILALFYYLTSLHSDVKALVVAQDEDSVTAFNHKVRFTYHRNTPARPETLLDNRNSILFGIKETASKKTTGSGLNSEMYFETVNKPGLGRSYTIQYLHLSEYAQYESFGIKLGEVMPGLYNAVPEMPGTIIIKESTSKGAGAAKDFWDEASKGDNCYRPVFISWISEESYRTPLKPGEVLEPCGSEEIAGMPTIYGNEKEESRLIKRELIFWYPENATDEAWIKKETLARLKWRRDTIHRKCNNDKNHFRREYPTTIAHAWTVTSSNCFDEYSLEQMRDYVREEALEPVLCNYIHDTDNEDANQKFKEAPYGKVRFYLLPEPHTTYVLGADTSLGLTPTSDLSALVVLKVTPDRLEEAASFNGLIPSDEFAAMVHYLGKLYNHALVGVEHNERSGAVVNNALYKYLHYPRLYFHTDPITRKRNKMPGIFTGGGSGGASMQKSIVVADFAQLIRDHAILFRTTAMLDQLAHYMEYPDGKLGGAPGWHDDLVMAGMIGS